MGDNFIVDSFVFIYLIGSYIVLVILLLLEYYLTKSKLLIDF